MIKCPRCRNKMDIQDNKCQKCGLKTTQILRASNAEAMKTLHNRRKDEAAHIIFIKQTIKPIEEQIKENKKLYKYAVNDKEKNALAYKINELRGERIATIAKLNRANYDAIYYTSLLPKDLSKTKLLIYALTLGGFGAHAFYVGRIGRGITITILWSLFLIGFFYFQFFSINHVFIQQVLERITSILGALAIIFIFTDVFKIVFNRFKVPVKIPQK